MNPARFSVSVDHPALAGHFPDHPIVPGVVLLDEILAIAQSLFPERPITGIREAKFHQALPPGSDCRLEILSLADNALSFKGYHQTELVIQGTLMLSDNRPSA